MPRSYSYVGPPEHLRRDRPSKPGALISCRDDVRGWMAASGQKLDRDGSLVVTFVVDGTGALRLADRHSEHVACAGFGPVLAAGEMTLRVACGRLEVDEVTNQSTGYCPEPEPWPAVAAALARAGFSPPAGYAVECIFRRCEGCGATNLVKDTVYECAMCGAGLPLHWNFDPVAPRARSP